MHRRVECERIFTSFVVYWAENEYSKHDSYTICATFVALHTSVRNDCETIQPMNWMITRQSYSSVGIANGKKMKYILVGRSPCLFKTSHSICFVIRWNIYLLCIWYGLLVHLNAWQFCCFHFENAIHFVIFLGISLDVHRRSAFFSLLLLHIVI